VDPVILATSVFDVIGVALSTVALVGICVWLERS